MCWQNSSIHKKKKASLYSSQLAKQGNFFDTDIYSGDIYIFEVLYHCFLIRDWLPTYKTSLIFDIIKETNFENRCCNIAFFGGNFSDCLLEVLIK